MQWLKDIKDKLDEDPVSLGWWVVATVLAMAKLASGLNWWNEKVSAVIRVAIIPEKSGASVAPWLLYLTDLFLFSLPILALLVIQAERARRKAVRGRSETSTIAHKTMLGMMRAAARIRHQAFPDDPGQKKTYMSVDLTYLISKDFTTEVTRKYAVRAASKPIHFWEIYFWVNDDAEPMDYLDNMDFKIESHDEDKHIVYLPIENGQRRKTVVLYFLPPMDPSEARPRTVSIKFKWPKMLGQMGRIGEEKFSWVIDSVEPVERVRAEFFLEPGTGKNLECELAGTDYGVKPQKVDHPTTGWPGIVYEVINAPKGRSEYSLNLRLRKP